MSQFQYTFDASIPFEEVEASLLLASFALESLHGSAASRLEANSDLDAQRRRCRLQGDTAAGRDLNRLFLGFLSREFPASAFQVARVADSEEPLHVAL